IALLAGYFFAFEYSVIARSYGLGVLLLVAALAVIGRPRPRWLLATVMLVLLAWTSLAGAVLAGAIAGSLALMWWRDRRRGALALVVLVARVLRPYALAFVLWIVGTLAYVVFSIVVVLPDRAHYAGEFFLLFVACAWLADAPPGGGRPVSASWRTGLPAVLVVV